MTHVESWNWVLFYGHFSANFLVKEREREIERSPLNILPDRESEESLRGGGGQQYSQNYETLLWMTAMM
jgi:hypothetical protein